MNRGLRIAALRVKSSPWVHSLPGIALFLLLWLLVYQGLAPASIVESAFNSSMQFLPPDAVRDQPLASLLGIHIQPPLLTSLQVVDIIYTPTSHALFLSSQLVVGGLTIVLLVQTLEEVGISPRVSTTLGMFYALLPATVLYAFLPGGTSFVALGGVILIRATTLVSRRPISSALLTGIGLLLLYLGRPTFTWIFVIGWLAVYASIFLANTRATRTRVLSLALLLVLVFPIFVTQSHYMRSFGTFTTSSWTGQNIMKAQTQSGWLRVSESTLSSLSVNRPCEHSLLTSLLSTRTQNDVWDIDKGRQLIGCDVVLMEKSSPSDALQLTSKGSGSDAAPNLNSLSQLELSKAWNRIAIEVIQDEPQRLLWMALTSGSGSVGSGLGLYLDPPEPYFGLAEQRTAYPTPLLLIGGLASLLLAPSSLVLGILGVASVFRHRRDGLSLGQILLLASMLLLGYHVAVSTLFEYGENMRYQAEMVPVLITIGALAVKQITSHFSPRIRSLGKADAQ